LKQLFSEIAGKSNTGNRKEVEDEIRIISDKMESETDDLLRRYYALELENKIADLNERLDETGESSDKIRYSTVEILWQMPKEQIPEPETSLDNSPTIPGMSLPPTLNFQNYGEIESMDSHLPFSINLNKMMEEELALKANFDADNENITIETERSDGEDDENLTIVLNKRCQTYDLGLGPIPKIIVTPNIQKEQIVITPKVDDKCNVIGFELRVGTVESGCANGRENLDRLKNCTKYKQAVAKTKSTKKAKAKKDQDVDLFFSLP
jgi:hypothetical protein